MLDVACRGQQDHPLTMTDDHKPCNSVGCGWGGQLGSVSPGEFYEPVRIVAVPAAQLGAGSNLLGPLVQPSFGLLDPTGPQAVDEHTVSVAVLRDVIDPPYREGSAVSSRGHGGMSMSEWSLPRAMGDEEAADVQRRANRR